MKPVVPGYAWGCKFGLVMYRWIDIGMQESMNIVWFITFDVYAYITFMCTHPVLNRSGRKTLPK